MNPAMVVERLAAIEQDLAERQNDAEAAAGDKARLIREWEYSFAVARKVANGKDADERKAAAYVAAADKERLLDRLKEAEGEYEAARTAIRVLETRANLGMAILKSMGRG